MLLGFWICWRNQLSCRGVFNQTPGGQIPDAGRSEVEIPRLRGWQVPDAEKIERELGRRGDLEKGKL